MTLPSHDPIDTAAATWLTRRRNGLDATGEGALRDWLQADPRHAEAYAGMERALAQAQGLPARDVSRLKAGLRTAPRPSARARPARALAGLAFTAVATLAAGWLGWQHWRQPTFEQRYATARGQQVTATLPDGDAAEVAGSTLQLDTATQAEARLYRDRREVRLKEGQAMFSVRSDAKRPFHVWAGPLRITVVGTRFSVRRTLSGLEAGQTVVSVEEGRVRVAPEAGDAEAIELSAGQRVAADGAGRLGPVLSVSPTDVAPWRSGRISFDHTPLGEVLAEFERYGPTGLMVRDPAVAALPVGGSYSLAQFRRFADALPQMLPVRLVPRDGAMEVVAR